jgi:hypothetical protein
MSKLIYTCLWQIHFYNNQKEIVALECENKNRPELHCNGKCYLAKKLRVADEQLQTKKDQQSHSLQKIKALEDSDVTISLFKTDEITPLISDVSISVVNHVDLYVYEPYPSIFHPPSC